MNHFILSAIIAFFLSFGCGLRFVFRTEFKERIFGFYLLSISFWSFFVGFQFLLLKSLPDRVWGWLLHLGCIYIPAIFFHFASVYTDFRFRSLLLKISYFIATLFIVLNTFTSLFTDGTAYRDSYSYPRPSLVYPLYFIFFIVNVLLGTLLLVKYKKYINPKVRLGYFIFLIAHSLAYLGALDNFFIMADIRIFPLYPFGLYLTTPYILCASFFLDFSKRYSRGSIVNA